MIIKIQHLLKSSFYIILTCFHYKNHYERRYINIFPFNKHLHFQRFNKIGVHLPRILSAPTTCHYGSSQEETNFQAIIKSRETTD
jgi:hypothetical protein